MWCHTSRTCSGMALFVMFGVMAFSVKPVLAGGEFEQELMQKSSSCEQAECVRCDLATGRCMKCVHTMQEGSRRCLPHCPAGHAATWRDDRNYRGAVCAPGSLLSVITGRDVAVIACAAAGGAVCVGIILGALLYARRRALAKPLPDDAPPACQPRRITAPRLWRDPRPSAADVPVGPDERKAFLRGLAGLRAQTGLLLAMLGETRARFRGFTGPDHNMDTKARAYRAVVRDLTRVVTLVSRRDESFTCVPADWRRLLAWAERLLARYRRQHDGKPCVGCGELHISQPHEGVMPNAPALHPLFQTRQQAQEQRWKKQREESDANRDTAETRYEDNADNTHVNLNMEQSDVCHADTAAVTPKLCESLLSFSPAILEETLQEDALQEDALEEGLQDDGDIPHFMMLEKVDQHDIEISYTKDEEALANQRAQFSVVDENLKNDMKTNNNNFDVGGLVTSKAKKERGSPSMISRIFCNKILNNNDLNINANLNDLHKTHKTNDINILQDDECISSSSIYDHIEAFTFDDFNVLSKPVVKHNNLKPKNKTTANLNVTRLRKPNFLGYSESFKQILDKKNLLIIPRTKIQKRFSRKGVQERKVVKRSDSRFQKDRDKMDPNLTYDRRNCKNDLLNHEMVGGDVYVSVVKQPVVERQSKESLESQGEESLGNQGNEFVMGHHTLGSGCYTNLDELKGEVMRGDELGGDVMGRDKMMRNEVNGEMMGAQLEAKKLGEKHPKEDKFRKDNTRRDTEARGSCSKALKAEERKEIEDLKNIRCELLTIV